MQHFVLIDDYVPDLYFNVSLTLLMYCVTIHCVNRRYNKNLLREESLCIKVFSVSYLKLNFEA